MCTLYSVSEAFGILILSVDAWRLCVLCVDMQLLKRPLKVHVDAFLEVAVYFDRFGIVRREYAT